MTNLEYKVVKTVKLDEDTRLRVLRNETLDRVAVEFSSNTCKFVVQKSFQDTYEGNLDAEEFQKTIKNANDLKRYFGVK